jgi:hypothetical protein
VDNHSYNIIKTITEKAEATWVYDKYIDDSENCQECSKFWKNLKKEDSKLLDQLRTLLNSHIESGQIEDIQVQTKSKGSSKKQSYSDDGDLYRTAT